MKKVFLAVLCAGLFFACGNKKQAEPTTLIDTTEQEELVEDVIDTIVDEVAAVVEDEPVATTTPKTTNTNKTNKTTQPTKAQKEGIQQVNDNSNKKEMNPNSAPQKKEETSPQVNTNKKGR